MQPIRASVSKHIKPKRSFYERLRDLSHFREHWRYRKLMEQLRNLPAQFTQVVYGLPTVQMEHLVPDNVVPEPAIMEDLCLPNHVEPPGHNDLQPLLQLLKHYQPQVVVELGTAHGNTTANICKQSPSARVYSVNALPEQISGEIITFALTRNEIGRVYRHLGYSHRVQQIYANTLDLNLAKYLRPASVDFAIVDACHDTPFVINDFSKLVPFMHTGGIILLHDTHPSMEEHLLGSYRACMYLRQLGYDIRHIQNTWWGYWLAPGVASR